VCGSLSGGSLLVWICVYLCRLKGVGTLTLIKVMPDHNVKNLVYSSLSSVYGTPQKLPLTEDHHTGQRCTNPYGKSKFMVEEILKDISTRNGA
jgi:UDP-glucose 4-epimerase